MRIINVILFTIIIFQTSCSTLLYQPRNDDPIIQLEQKYTIRLDATWTTKQAQALLKTFASISPEFNPPLSIWKISNDDIQNDIKIESQNGVKSVTISRNVFPIEEYQGILAPDKRLFQAVVQFITESGANRSAIKLILQERYGISIDTPPYELLTKGNAKEPGARLSDFENEDLMIFISILEEFPQALHKVSQLKYVVCRSDNNMDDSARAWTTLNFIEVAESVFDDYDFKYICHIMVHEKAHFLWQHLFPDQLKQDWIKLGGWYKDKESESGWSTTKDRKEFVTDYAYEKNPNEDLAESLGFYLVYPDKLRSSSAAKYDFIDNRIMLTYGTRYISPDLMNSSIFR